jgi:hypothetical protein
MHLLVILLPNYRTYPLQIGYWDETLQELSSGSFTIESWEHVLGMGLALKIWGEVQQSYPVNPLLQPWKNTYSFQGLGGALEKYNKYCQIVFIDCSLFPIG